MAKMSKQIGIPPPRTLILWGLGALFVLCWSSGFIGAKLGASDAPVTTILMWRFLPLALVLLPRLLHRDHPGGGTSWWARQIAIGALSQSGYLLTVYWAIALGVSSGTTSLIDGMQPLVIATLAGPLLSVTVTGRQWFGLVIGLGGVLLATRADAAAPETTAPWWAYTIPFAGMGCLVIATFLERRTPGSAPPPMMSLAIHCTTSAAIFSTLAIATRTATPPATWGFWFAMAWLIILSTLGGYGLYWYLLGRLGVTEVNTLMFLIPPVTTIWGAVMFGEPITRTTVLGISLALLATWIVTHARAESPTTRKPPATTEPDSVRPAHHSP